MCVITASPAYQCILWNTYLLAVQAMFALAGDAEEVLTEECAAVKSLRAVRRLAELARHAAVLHHHLAQEHVLRFAALPLQQLTPTTVAQ